MGRLRKAASVAAAVVSLAIGVAGALRPDVDREPVWAHRVAAVAAAPLPAGTRVALLVPEGGEADVRDRLLFELAWQRPDLLWSDSTGVGEEAVVTFGPVATPGGWRRTWAEGELAVLQRAGP